MEAQQKRKRVLFLCIGNICRSPMAEALARKYGSDVLEASSAGLSPGLNSHATVRAILGEKNVELGAHVPRRIRDLDLRQFDLIVNISGEPLLATFGIPLETWNVRDPFGGTEEEFRNARDELEMLVMGLILRIRTGKI